MIFMVFLLKFLELRRGKETIATWSIYLVTQTKLNVMLGYHVVDFLSIF